MGGPSQNISQISLRSDSRSLSLKKKLQNLIFHNMSRVWKERQYFCCSCHNNQLTTRGSGACSTCRCPASPQLQQQRAADCADDGAKMAAGYAWFLVLGSVFLCNLMKTLLPSISSFVSIDYKLCLLFFFLRGEVVHLSANLVPLSPGRRAQPGA